MTDDFADLRALFSTRDGQPAEEFLYEQASPKTKALLDAYSVGVNTWIEDMKNGETFSLEFTHPALEYSPDGVPEWTPQDSVAAVLALVESLTNDESRQIDAAVAREAINDDAKFSDLWARRPLEESAILPDWEPPAPSAASEKRLAGTRPSGTPLRERLNAAPVIQRLHQELERTRELRQMILGSYLGGDEIGSNNWVVGPSRTIAGNALLSNDPHLDMTQPATWYLAHLDAKTHGVGEIHAAGTTFAGLPWVIVGQNESIAWGLTTTYMDFSDVYIETLVKDGSGNPTGVMLKGAEVPFTRSSLAITFGDGSTEDKELLFVPHHGAVREIDADNNTVITLRWTGNDVDTDISFLTELGKATTLEEARVAVSNTLETVGNFLVAELGADETQWAWGRLHGLLLSSDLSTFGIFAYDNPAPGEPLFANDGGLFTVDVANPGQQDFVQRAGPSTRLVCEGSRTVRAAPFSFPVASRAISLRRTTKTWCSPTSGTSPCP